MRKHLESARQQLLPRAADPRFRARLEDLAQQLAMPPFPDVMHREWQWFTDLDRARGSSGFGPLPISFVELHSFFDLHSVRPSRRQLDVLRMLDGIALKSYADEMRDRK